MLKAPYILLGAGSELRAIHIGRFSVVGLRGTTIQLISKPFVFTAYIKCLYRSQLAVQIKYSYYNIVDRDWSTYMARLFCKCFPIVTKSSFMHRAFNQCYSYKVYINVRTYRLNVVVERLSVV